MALSSVASEGVGRASAFRGAYWAPSTYRESYACAMAHSFPARWAAATGDGKGRASTRSKTCPAYRGGASVGSYGTVEEELSIYAPVTLTSGLGGVNVSWSLRLTAADAAAYSGSSRTCPTTSYSSSYYFGYTYWNYTETYGTCADLADIELGGSAELIDLTTGKSYSASNYWYTYNETYVENYSVIDSATYSNSSYWTYNYTYSYAYNGSGGFGYGPLSPGTFAGLIVPQWFIKGTFSSTDRYEVETDVYSYEESESIGFASFGDASTSMNLASGANHEDLLPFSIW